MARQSTKKSLRGPAPHAATDDVIRFYRSNEKPYGAFSNLYRRSIEFEGTSYPTSEHAYQAGKAAKKAVRDWILAAPSPSLAAMAAHGLYIWDVVPNWSQIKFDRMRRVLRAKFEQHQDLAKLLISTGDKRLIEAGTVNNSVNRLWGEVGGIGKNMLGVMLMEIRKELRSQPKKPAVTRGVRETIAKGSSRKTKLPGPKPSKARKAARG